ncbi:hypothetical protein MTO96_030068 [Rhipicephalus appendiculatus]
MAKAGSGEELKAKSNDMRPGRPILAAEFQVAGMEPAMAQDRTKGQGRFQGHERVPALWFPGLPSSWEDASHSVARQPESPDVNE